VSFLFRFLFFVFLRYLATIIAMMAAEERGKAEGIGTEYLHTESVEKRLKVSSRIISTASQAGE
jgi:hypothetical protein